MKNLAINGIFYAVYDININTDNSTDIDIKIGVNHANISYNLPDY